MTTTRHIRRGIRVLWVVLLLVPTAQVNGAVSIHPPDAVDFPHSVLSTRVILDDLDPVGSSWQTVGGQSGGNTELNGDGHLNGDGEPSVLIHPETGMAMAAWAQSGPAGFDIVLSRFTSGSWTSPEVLVGSSEDELDPFLLVDPVDGNVHLFYWVHDAGPRVMHKEAPADLSEWSTPIRVSSFGEIAARPAAALVDGALQVVYERHSMGYGSTPRQIVLATRDGSTFHAQAVGSTFEAGSNWPEVHAREGKLWIEWVDGPNAMAWTVWGPTGWEPLQYEGFSGTEDRTFRVRGRIRAQALE